MFGSEKRQLEALFVTPDPSPAHRAALEEKLVADFARRRANPVARPSFRLRPAFALSLGILALGGVAFGAPISMEAIVGRSLSFSLAQAEAPDPETLAKMVMGISSLDSAPGHGQSMRGVTMRLTKDGQASTVHLDIWGTDLPDGTYVDKLRQAVPSLASVPIQETPLETSVRTSVGTRLAHDLFGMKLDQMTVDQATAAVKRQLAGTEDEGAEVHVEKFEPGGGTKVRVEKREVKTSP
jgi:hypothetical protein